MSQKQENATACPCYSGEPYRMCCKPYHDGKQAPNAKALMRSRYSAYVLHNAAYIMATTHHDNRQHRDDKALWAKDIDTFSENTSFVGLEILEFVDGEDTAFVTFKAHLKQRGNDASFTERSRFMKEYGRWLYVDGEVTR